MTYSVVYTYRNDQGEKILVRCGNIEAPNGETAITQAESTHTAPEGAIWSATLIYGKEPAHV